MNHKNIKTSHPDLLSSEIPLRWCELAQVCDEHGHIVVLDGSRVTDLGRHLQVHCTTVI